MTPELAGLIKRIDELAEKATPGRVIVSEYCTQQACGEVGAYLSYENLYYTILLRSRDAPFYTALVNAWPTIRAALLAEQQGHSTADARLSNKPTPVPTPSSAAVYMCPACGQVYPGQSPASAAQSGDYVWVPREPTEEMLKALGSARDNAAFAGDLYYVRRRAAYKAMIAAAAPPGEGERK